MNALPKEIRDEEIEQARMQQMMVLQNEEGATLDGFIDT